MPRRSIIIIGAILIICFILTIVGVTVLIRNSREQFPTTTPTPTPTATQTPTGGQGGNLKEEFENNNNGWALGTKTSDFGTTNEYLSDGRLYINVTANRAISLVDTIDGQPYSLALKVDTDQISGPASASQGLVFRKTDDNNYYYFGVSKNTKKYMLGVKVNGAWETILDWTYADFINQATSNKLTVDTTGTKIDLTINDIILNSINNDRINTGGEAGIAVELYNTGDNALFVFDGFELTVK